jgi:hypothetical protein
LDTLKDKTPGKTDHTYEDDDDNSPMTKKPKYEG